MYGLLATLVVVVHFVFIVFVVSGGLLVWRWRRAVWVHLPMAAWGGFVALSGRVCPLTPLENRFRRMAGAGEYPGDFLDRYLVSLIYPSGLTREAQIALGVGVIVVNVAIYSWAIRRRRRARAEP